MDNTKTVNNKKELVQELILILDKFDDLDENEIDIYYYPWIGGADKENNPKYTLSIFILDTLKTNLFSLFKYL